MSIVKMSGVVSNIQKATTVKGKEYYKVTIGSGGNSTVASVWDWNTIRDIKIGSEADFDMQQEGDRGQFLSIKSAVPVLRGDYYPDPARAVTVQQLSQTATHLPPVSQHEGGFAFVDANPHTPPSKDRMIVRQACLKAAAALFTGAGPEMDEAVVGSAKLFESYVFEGE